MNGDLPLVIVPVMNLWETLFYHYGSRTQNQRPGSPVVSSPRFEENRARYVREWGGTPGQERFLTPFDGG